MMTTNATTVSSAYRRLESLDALRGLDLCFLVALGPFMNALAGAIDAEWMQPVMWCFRHAYWTGFSPWDLIMPLFLFMSGISMPFALSRFKREGSHGIFWKRLIKRVILLWIFGMMCQGNLLALNPDQLYFYSNTLQAIATGYFFTAILFMYTARRTQIIIAAVLLAVYWALMQFVSIDGYGAGNYSTQYNLAEWVDQVVLGRFRDTAKIVDGQVVIAPWYHYTWILSSLNFVVTVLTGLFAGYIAKDATDDRFKLKMYFGIGAALVVIGWIWGLQMPVIKTIWTSSMTLVSSGYCFLLMGLFYYWIDFKGHHAHVGFLKIYGMNSITAYMLANVVNFSSIGRSLFHGLEQYIGNYYPLLITASNITIVFLILLAMHKRGLFLRV